MKLRAVLRRRWPLLAAGFVLGVVAGVVSSLLAPDDDGPQLYRAVEVIISNSTARRSGVEQDSLRVTRGEVAELAAATLGERPQQAARRVSAVADRDSSSITISATGTSPELAQFRVNAFATAFLQVVNSDLLADQERRLAQLDGAVNEARADLEAFDAANPNLSPLNPAIDPNTRELLLRERAELEQRLQEAEDSRRADQLEATVRQPYSSLGPESARTVDNDLLPVPDSMPFRAGLLGLFGLALSVGLIMVVERLNPRIDTRVELVTALELPVLAEVGHFGKRKIPRNPDGTLRLDGPWAESYRRIRAAIEFVQSAAGDGPVPRSFMFASPSPGAGKSTSVAVTALAMAEAGQRTLVLGGDFRRPSVHTLLGVPPVPGVRERAALDVDRPSIEDVVHPTDRHDLFVTPSGEPGRDVVGMAKAAREVIAAAVAHDATVLVDTSPVEVANDSIDLLPAVDEVILVVRSGRTTHKALLHTVEQLRQHGASLMGTTLIGTPGTARQQYYYEGYYSAKGDGPAGGTDASAWVTDPSPKGGDDSGAAAGGVNGSADANGDTAAVDDAQADLGGAGAGEPSNTKVGSGFFVRRSGSTSF